VDVAALILWILTAGGGFFLLGTWLAKGGARAGGPGSRFPVPLIFGHFLLAATGLVLWIIYVAMHKKGFGWTAFGVLAVVALLGFTMLALWIPTFRAARTAAAGTAPAAPRPSPTAGTGDGSARATATATPATATAGPAERHFPLVVVIGHGLLAATTLVLVLLAMLEVGS
jgi:hypothetical protein